MPESTAGEANGELESLCGQSGHSIHSPPDQCTDRAFAVASAEQSEPLPTNTQRPRRNVVLNEAAQEFIRRAPKGRYGR